MGAARGLIVEGIPGTGKTTLIRAMQRLDQFLERDSLSCLLFGEEMTQRTLERATWEGSLRAEDHFALFSEILQLIERQQERFAYRGWDGSKENHKVLFYLLERFHLTHAAYYPYLQTADFSGVEERLHSLDARGCLLIMDRYVMKERIIESRAATAWHNYISRYGNTPLEIVDHYCRQQQAMLERVQKSRLPWLVLDTSDGAWDKLADKLVKHWMNTTPLGD